MPSDRAIRQVLRDEVAALDADHRSVEGDLATVRRRGRARKVRRTAQATSLVVLVLVGATIVGLRPRDERTQHVDTSGTLPSVSPILLDVVPFERPPVVRRIETGLPLLASWLVASPDGGVWMIGTEAGSEEYAVAYRSPGGDVRGPVALPGPEEGAKVTDAILRPDGNAWLALRAGRGTGEVRGSFVRVTPSLDLTAFGGLPPNQDPFALTPAADGRLWFWADTVYAEMNMDADRPRIGSRGSIGLDGTISIVESFPYTLRDSSSPNSDPSDPGNPAKEPPAGPAPEHGPAGRVWPGFSYLLAGEAVDGTVWFRSTPDSDIGGTRGLRAVVRRPGARDLEYDVTRLVDKEGCCLFYRFAGAQVAPRSGDLWFEPMAGWSRVEEGSHTVARITRDGRLSAVTISAERAPYLGITLGGDDTVWWAGSEPGVLYRLTLGDPDPRAGTPLPTLPAGPGGCLGIDPTGPRPPGTGPWPSSTFPPDRVLGAPFCGPKGPPDKPT